MEYYLSYVRWENIMYILKYKIDYNEEKIKL